MQFTVTRLYIIFLEPQYCTSAGECPEEHSNRTDWSSERSLGFLQTQIYKWLPSSCVRDSLVFISKSSRQQISSEILHHFTPLASLKEDNLFKSPWKQRRDLLSLKSSQDLPRPALAHKHLANPVLPAGRRGTGAGAWLNISIIKMTQSGQTRPGHETEYLSWLYHFHFQSSPRI